MTATAQARDPGHHKRGTAVIGPTAEPLTYT